MSGVIKTIQKTMKKVTERQKSRYMSKIINHCLAISLLGLPFSAAHADDLAQIFQLAATNDPEIRQARANYNAAHTTIDQGRSFLLPRVTVGGSTSRDTSGPAQASAF